MSQLATVEATGDGNRIGRAIAAATSHLRAEVAQWCHSALAAYAPDEPGVRASLHELRTMLEEHSPSTLGQVEGMARGYGVPADGLLVAVLATYFASADIPGGDRGCSTFAVRGAAGRPPVLAKNRDSDQRFRSMQTIVRVQPAAGYEWLALSTAGAPAVHSAGINERGLAVADTHVPSTDVGIGLPRFSLMMHALEQCGTTDEAIAYLESVPRMGFGNLILADAEGAVAVVECGHSRLAVIEPAGDEVCATNHFVSDGLAGTCRHPAGSAEGLDSRARRRRLAVDLADADRLAGDPLGALSVHEQPGATCVHGDEGSGWTIATVVAHPDQRSMAIGVGTPCRAIPQRFSLAAERRGD
ncbi:C45 family peptidase [Jatrophihabitans cynanchi]|uniref:C45 family peptidase n=1 Tax=Jatrophihabitans cynanchi TaxID=2944128 RepID=A0ABY7JVE6_9ACTN|nr:C45 family peptidase [Jatrophihabitans sp. SB3-54]WAX55154.1 C45 family peptidase [Jatrophihabitans sp. SB3-54]